MIKNAIELKNLTKMYGVGVGVKDISLSVPQGSVFGFLGPNGAGKSTTINMLVDLIRPTSGHAVLFGLDSVKDSLKVRRTLGFLSGEMSFDGSLTGRQQLEYFGNLHENVDRKYIEKLSTRLHAQLDKKIKNMSRGNRQKIGLISALMHKPKLLVLDEPTSGLDPLIQAEFNALLVEHKQNGGTAFVSSHVLSEVQEICDTVAFIREGELIAQRNMDDLTKQAQKQISITGASKQLQQKLQKLDGLTEFVQTGVRVTALFQGNINSLLQLISGYAVSDVSISDVDLESIFMTFYEKKDV